MSTPTQVGAPRVPVEGGGLREQLARWVSHGLVSAEQADAIAAFEASEDVRRTHVPLFAEVLGYLGSALALGASVTLVSEHWDAFPTWVKLLVFATVSIAAWAGARRVGLCAQGAAGRLASLLGVLPAFGCGGIGAVVAFDLAGTSGATAALAAGVAASTYALAVWWRVRRPLQQVALFGAVSLAAGATIAEVPGATSAYVGAALWAVGAVWLALAARRVFGGAPTGMALGCGGVLFGAQVFAGQDGRWALFLGVASALGLLAASLPLHSMVLVGFGSAGVLMFVPETVFRVFGPALGAPLALLLCGVTLVAVSVSLARARTRGAAPG